MEGGLLLDVVIRKSSAVLELLSSEDESLLIGRDAFLVLDLGLHVIDGVRGLDLESDGLSGKSLDEDLHTTSKSEDQVKSGLLLDVIIGEGTAIFELLSSEDETLLIGRNSLLVLDLSLDIVDGVGRLDFEGDSLTGEGLHEDLHTTTESKDEMESGFLLDVVVTESTAILELLSGEDESLLIGGNTLLILNLSLDVVDGVGGLDLKSDGLSSEGLDEDLHTTSESEDEMEGRLLLDIVVRKGTAILKLLTGEDKTLLIGWDTFLILDLSLHVINSVGWLNLKGDGLASESFNENLHSEVFLFIIIKFCVGAPYIGSGINQIILIIRRHTVSRSFSTSLKISIIFTHKHTLHYGVLGFWGFGVLPSKLQYLSELPE